jgi:hypothetical protein
MTDTYTVYECTNESCSLGSMKTPGRFSGGATKQQITLLTGDPEPENHGEGICPNCGEPGHKLKDIPAPHEGTDPLQPLHDKIGGKAEKETLAIRDRVMDTSDDFTPEEGLQAVSEISQQAQAKINAAAENQEADDNA